MLKQIFNILILLLLTLYFDTHEMQIVTINKYNRLYEKKI
jgi:hypothetical protein